MRYVNRERDISHGQRVARGVRFYDFVRIDLRGCDINADAIDAESAGDFSEDAAAAATNVEHPLNGQRIKAKSMDEVASISEEAMNGCEFAIGVSDEWFWNIVAIQDLERRRFLHWELKSTEP